MYQFQFERTMEDYKALSRVSDKTAHKKSTLVHRVLYGVYAVCFFALGAVSLYLQKWVLVALYMSVGLFFLVSNIRWHSLAAWRTQQRALKNVGAITMCLEETGIRAKHTKTESFFPYEAFDGAYYYRECYFLTIESLQVVDLPERALVEGDPATLKAFLEEKLHKEVKEIP